MPNWKKVIVSGSDASLNSITTPAGTINSITASYALTASYSNNLQISGSINNVDYIDFNTGSATPAWKSGRVFWDNTDGVLSVYNAEADITLQVGQENWTRVRNNTGTTITNGTAVRLDGAQGDVPTVTRAQSIQVSGSVNLLNQILGIATHDIEDNSFGYITTQGLVRGLNTNAFNDGDTLFVGTGSAGVLQNTAPRAPYEIIPVGVCVKAGPGGSGIIYVAVQQPIDFSDLSSALVQGTYSYGDLWTYKPSGSSGVWTHTNQLSGSYGVTGSYNISGSLNTMDIVPLSAYLYNIGSTGNPYATINAVNHNSPANLSMVGSLSTYIGAGGTYGIGMFQTTRNILIQDGGSYTDAGYRLDVNGTTRFNGNSTITGSLTTTGTISTTGHGYFNQGIWSNIYRNLFGVEVFRITLTSNNMLIGTTTDDVYRLDVSGSTRFTGDSIISGSLEVKNSIVSANRRLVDSNIEPTINWEEGYLLSASSATLDWKNKILYDSNTANSIDWNARRLYKTDGLAVTLDWETGALTGSLYGTASYATRALSSSFTTTSSYALTASYALNGGGGGATFNGGTNVNNRLITATGTTPELNGEPNLTFDGSTLAVNGDITATSFTGTVNGTASWASQSTLSQLATSASYAQTASFVNTLAQNVTINGNLQVNGTASYTYVTSSQLDVGTNFISVNIGEPAERFGGLKVYDSGSLSHLATASLAWDSLNNHWIYQNASGSTYSGGMLMSGPRNTGSLGDEPSLTRWFVARSDGGDHLNNTQIYSSASTHIVTGSLGVSGSLGVTGSVRIQIDDNAFTTTQVLENINTGGSAIAAITFRTANQPNNTATVGQLSSGDMIVYNSATNGKINFSTNATQRMTINSNGDVGIGSNLPAYKLDVNGDIATSGSIISTTNGAFKWDSSGYLYAGNFSDPLTNISYQPDAGITSITDQNSISGNWPGASKYNGQVLANATAGETFTRGQLLYLRDNGKWLLADASAVASSTPLLGIALTDGVLDDVCAVLLDGIIGMGYHAQVGSATPGLPLYVSTTTGDVTETAPSATGDVVRLIGHNIQDVASGTVIIRFQPDNTWIEL